MLVVVILGLLAALAVPNIQEVVQRARSAKAIADISVLGQNISEFHLLNDRYPTDLAERVRWLWRRPDVSTLMGKEARLDFESRYSDAPAYDSLMRIYAAVRQA